MWQSKKICQMVKSTMASESTLSLVDAAEASCCVLNLISTLLSRPSQITCTAMTVYVMCMQTAFCVYENCENWCTVLIHLCKNNLNVSMCLSFFFCPVLGCLHLSFIVLSYLLPCRAALILFVCFYGSRFCSPTINQTSLSQSKGWFPLILLCIWEKYH